MAWSGRDEERLDLPEGVRHGVLVYRGPLKFVNWSPFNSDGARVIAAIIGPQEPGSLALLMAEPANAEHLDFDVTGDWTLELWPLSSLPALPPSGQATSSAYVDTQCYLYGGAGGPTELAYQGEGVVQVDQHSVGGTTRLLETMAGDVTATRTMDPGPSVVCLTLREGKWQITPAS